MAGVSIVRGVLIYGDFWVVMFPIAILPRRSGFIDSSCLVRSRRGEDDKGRDCLVLGRDGRPSTAGTQYWSMRQILVLKQVKAKN